VNHRRKIPTGFRPPAQGCEERATSGQLSNQPTTPTGGHLFSVVAVERTARGVYAASAWHNPCNTAESRPRAGSAGQRPRADQKREREQMPWLGPRGGWGQKGWTCGRGKQGDPSGPERCSWPVRPKSRPAGVRASVVARKRGNARGAKGRRKVEA